MKERLFQIIRAPVSSEKAVNLVNKNQIALKVLPDATKQEIKEAVEAMFDVKVSRVCTLNVKPKIKRFRNIKGVRSSWKKAYVVLQEGQSAEQMLAMESAKR